MLTDSKELVSKSLSKILLDASNGAWILKDKIIPVKDECHAEYAFEILKNLIYISENHCERLKKLQTHLQFTRYYSMYRIMYRLGFIRMAVYDSKIYKLDYRHPNKNKEVTLVLEYSKYYKPNEFQEKVINRADYIDLIEIYYTRGRG